MGVAITMGLMILTNLVVGGSLLLLVGRTRKKPEPRNGPGPPAPLLDIASSYRASSRKQGLNLLGTIYDPGSGHA
jgi:hypothetical protein